MVDNLRPNRKKAPNSDRVFWELPPVPVLSPELMRRYVASQLQPNERARLWVETDLDRDANYLSGLLVLTDQSVITETANAQCEVIPLANIRQAIAREQGAVGSLELHIHTDQVRVYRYTIGHWFAVHRLVREIEKLQQADADSDDSGELDES